MATIEPVNGSGYDNPYVDSLIWGGGRWANGPITYSFASGTYSSDPSDPWDPPSGFGVSWESSETAALQAALQLYSNVANIQFQQAASYADADLAWWQLSEHDLDGFLGLHQIPEQPGATAPIDGFFNYSDEAWANLTPGSLGFLVIIHELGHGLGLAHPHDGGGQFDWTTFPGVTDGRPSDTGDFGLNQGIWTTMSYNEGWNRVPPVGRTPSYGCQATPMAFDIAALQELYGANTTYNNGDQLYTLPGVNESGTYWSCIWDTGGKDEISGAGLKGACTINLNDASLEEGDPNAGGFVSWMGGIRGGFTIANGVVIENATGGNGNDTLTGNEFVNILAGNVGNDSLIGELGADTLDGGVGKDAMLGGDGDDLYIVDIKTDKVTESLGAGDDTVESIVTYALAANVENLVLTSGDTKGTGNVLDNLIVGSDGNNTLDGKEGGDILRGGFGNDVYVVDGSDTVDEAGGDGTDTVQCGADFDLGKLLVIGDVENLTLTGTGSFKGTGDELANIITGNSGANALSGLGNNDSLVGGSGNDTLDGGTGDDTLDGGAGNDTMTGGAGDDVYSVNGTKDVVDDKGDGIDTIQAMIAIVLDNYVDIENVTLLGKAAIGATGDGSANHLIGSDGANILDGGAGVDVMEGNKGNDTYKVDDGKDQVIEIAGGGTDTVLSIIGYTLLDPNVENLTLLGAALLGTGNAAKNKLTGNDGANTLDGGAAVDTLIGGKGNDDYRVDETKDAVTEASGKDSGTDTVTSTAAVYTLGANVEKLTLGGTGDISGTGNTLNNVLTGNSGDNTLNGGAGADAMNGGLGNDTYVYDGKDTISDDGGFDIVQASIAIDLTLPAFVDLEGVRLTGAGALAATGDDGANLLVGNNGANKIAGGDGADTIEGAAGNDTIVGGAGNDSITGGAGTDRIDVGDGNDTVFYASKLDGKDIIDNFDGNVTDGQDTLNLDLLFDSLGVADGDRAGRVSLVVNDAGTAVDVKVNADANPNFFELTVATLNTVDPITVGADVVVGTL
jgi:Ca2+-binding RTX toxin-like protein